MPSNRNKRLSARPTARANTAIRSGFRTRPANALGGAPTGQTERDEEVSAIRSGYDNDATKIPLTHRHLSLNLERGHRAYESLAPSNPKQRLLRLALLRRDETLLQGLLETFQSAEAGCPRKTPTKELLLPKA